MEMERGAESRQKSCNEKHERQTQSHYHSHRAKILLQGPFQFIILFVFFFVCVCLCVLCKSSILKMRRFRGVKELDNSSPDFLPGLFLKLWTQLRGKAMGYGLSTYLTDTQRISQGHTTPLTLPSTVCFGATHLKVQLSRI